MEIKNNYKGEIYWWAYITSDTKYAISLVKGTIKPGKTDGWNDSSYPNYKLEIARDWKSGLPINNYTVILKPGTTYDASSKFTVDAKGKVHLEVPRVSDERIEERKISEISFRDLRGHSRDQEEEVVSEFYKAYTHSIATSETESSSSSWNVGGKLSGTYKGITGALSAGFESKVTQELKKNFESSVTESMKERRTKNLFFEGGKISMIKNVWLTQMKTGTISYFGEQAKFVVPISTNSSSLEIQTTYSDPDEMDESTRAIWDKHMA